MSYEELGRSLDALNLIFTPSKKQMLCLKIDSDQCGHITLEDFYRTFSLRFTDKAGMMHKLMRANH